MIEKILLKNFKCFEKIDVTCRELNLQVLMAWENRH